MSHSTFNAQGHPGPSANGTLAAAFTSPPTPPPDQVPQPEEVEISQLPWSNHDQCKDFLNEILRTLREAYRDILGPAIDKTDDRELADNFNRYYRELRVEVGIEDIPPQGSVGLEYATEELVEWFMGNWTLARAQAWLDREETKTRWWVDVVDFVRERRRQAEETSEWKTWVG